MIVTIMSYLLDFSLGNYRVFNFSASCLFALSLCYLLFNQQYLIAAFGLGMYLVQITGILLNIYFDQIRASGWLVMDIFKPDYLNIANLTLVVSIACFLYVGMLFGKNNSKSLRRNDQNDRYQFKSLVEISLLIFLTGSTLTILSAPSSLVESGYGGGQAEFAEPSSFGYIIGLSLLCSSIFMFLYKRKKTDWLSMFFLLSGVLIVINFNLLRGDRDGTLTFFVTLFAAYFIYSKKSGLGKVLRLSIGGVGLYLVLIFMGEIRTQVKNLGFSGAISQSTLLAGSRGDSNIFEKLDLLPMMYWHLLDAIDLCANGIDYDYRSFKNLPVQALPGGVSNTLGIDRPRNAAWDLEEYKLHGGGFFIVGEAYWNKGIWSAVGFTGILALLLHLVERWFYRQKKYLLGFYFALVATFPTCIYYGIQGMFRWIEVYFFFALMIKVLIWLYAEISRYRKQGYYVSLRKLLSLTQSN